MPTNETPIVFECAGSPTVAVVHGATVPASVGVLIVVGGPQYRVGSHRQFVLLARSLAAAGIPAMRFDHRGIGDSSGPSTTFDSITDDIRCAVDLFIGHTGVKRVALWGLCDAASAALIYGPSDQRVCALLLLNPWVHTEATEARVRLNSYYISRLKSKQFWRKLVIFDLDIHDSLLSIVGYVRSAFASNHSKDKSENGEAHFIERMRQGLNQFPGKVFILLSGNDITADEFRTLLAQDKVWKELVRRKVDEKIDIPGANHTFASAEWRIQVERRTIEWVQRLLKSNP